MKECMAALNAGEHDKAHAILQRGLSRYPDDAQLNNFTGKLLLGAGRNDDGIDHLQRAVASPDVTDKYILDLAVAPFPKNRMAESEAACRDGLKLAPHDPNIWRRLARALRALNRDEEARDAYARALELAGTRFGLLFNLANTELDLGEHILARDHFTQALDHDPNHPDAHLHLGFCHLALGDFTEGWRELEWRLKAPAFKSLVLDTPRWSGEAIDGTVLIQAEQGLGDTVQFIRYAPLVAERASLVVVRCQPELVRLMQSMEGVDQVATWDAPPPTHDVHVQAMSLPFVFDTQLDTIPAKVPYLHAAQDDIATWAEILSPLPGPKIAVTWSGNPDNPRDRLRTIPGDVMMDLARATDASFICMNKARPTDVKDWPDNLYHFGERFKDVADAAALLANVDLVVTIDTLLAHLAGALNLDTWVLLGPAAEWRYLEDRTDSPWYPGMRLMRRADAETWEEFLDGVGKQLKERLADV